MGLAAFTARLVLVGASAASANGTGSLLVFAISAPASLARNASAMVRGPFLRLIATEDVSATLLAVAVLAVARLRAALTAVWADKAAVSKRVSSLILRGSGRWRG